MKSNLVLYLIALSIIIEIAWCGGICGKHISKTKYEIKPAKTNLNNSPKQNEQNEEDDNKINTPKRSPKKKKKKEANNELQKIIDNFKSNSNLLFMAFEFLSIDDYIQIDQNLPENMKNDKFLVKPKKTRSYGSLIRENFSFEKTDDKENGHFLPTIQQMISIDHFALEMFLHKNGFFHFRTRPGEPVCTISSEEVGWDQNVRSIFLSSSSHKHSRCAYCSNSFHLYLIKHDNSMLVVRGFETDEKTQQHFCTIEIKELWAPNERFCYHVLEPSLLLVVDPQNEMIEYDFCHIFNPKKTDNLLEGYSNDFYNSFEIEYNPETKMIENFWIQPISSTRLSQTPNSKIDAKIFFQTYCSQNEFYSAFA